MRISDWSSDVCSSDLRQHRKFAAGAGADGLDMASHFQPRIGVETHFGGLADAHVGKVGLLEIGLDPGMRRIDQRHRWQTRDHHLRSEEHTSELQSLMRISYADFCLTKKK